jgi:type IV secretory pathway TraG/TraD family ATPase VirD4
MSNSKNFIDNLVSSWFQRSFLNKKEGSRFLESGEYEQFISHRYDGLLMDGQRLRLSKKSSFQNVMCFAKSGQNKTTTYVITNVLDRAKEDCSLFINDPKGDVFKSTAGYLETQGFDVIVYDPENPTKSQYFNPCFEAKTEIELDQIAQAIIYSASPDPSDRIWNDGAVNVLSVILKTLSYGKASEFNLVNLHHVLTCITDYPKMTHWISRVAHENDNIYLLKQWESVFIGEARMVGSFITNAMNAMKSFNNKAIRDFFHTSDYKLSDFRKKKTAIFLISPPNQDTYYSFIKSLMFKSIFNECMRDHHQDGHTLPVYLLMDEAGNTYIPDFPETITTVRSYRASVFLIFQSVSQLEEKYGKSGASAIHGGVSTEICLPGGDLDTTQYFSKLCGNVIDIQAKDELGIRTSRTEYSLVNPENVRTLPSNTAIIIHRNEPPVLLHTKPFYEVGKFRRFASISANRLVRRHKKINIPLTEF